MENKIVQYWGKLLQPITLEPAVESVLPQTTATFLKQTGLPNSEAILFNFGRLDTHLGAESIFRFRDTIYIVLGGEDGNKLCLQTKTGAIFLINTEHPPMLGDNPEEKPLLFVNTEIVRFLMFNTVIASNFEVFYAATSKQEKVTQGLKENYLNMVKDVETQFNTIDKAALEGEDCWWYWKLFDIRFMYY
jgi:hypothetical protein